MDVKQIYELVNTATQEAIGEQAIVSEDLSNLIDVGTSLFQADAYDRYVKSLINHIGKVVFVDRVYQPSSPRVMMDGWEYGSVLEKIQCEIPEATETSSWELTDGKSYDPNIFYQPKVDAKFYNSLTTFEVDVSRTRKQVMQSFSNAQQMGGFIGMLENSVANSVSIKLDELIMRTIDNMIAETIYTDYQGASVSEGSHTRTVNLLYLYNTAHGTALTAEEAIKTPEFIRYAAYVMKLYKSRLKKASQLFNVGGKIRFTPEDRLHVVMLEDFKSAADVYLQSDTWHNELTQLPLADTVAYWQGSGTSYGLSDVSSIKINSTGGHEISQSGILAVFFDKYALGVNNADRRVDSHYVSKGEFYNSFYRYDAAYFNDFNENFVVFIAA